jgi:multidrug efflux pump subunit AcrB
MMTSACTVIGTLPVAIGFASDAGQRYQRAVFDFRDGMR